MEYNTIEGRIRTVNSNDHSLEDQVTVTRVLIEHGIDTDQVALSEKEIRQILDKREIHLEYGLGTVLDNLQVAGVVRAFFRPGPDGYSISERLDGIINGEVEDTYWDDALALLDHLHQDEADKEDAILADGGITTVRSVVSNVLGVPPAEVEDAFTSGELWDRIQRLNSAIEAIEESKIDRRDTYGRIVYRNKKYHYRLTNWVTDQINKTPNI